VLGALAGRAAVGYAEPNGGATGRDRTVVSVTGAGARSAESPPAEPLELVPRQVPTIRVFYGWQILASGEVGGVLAAAAIVLPNSPTNTPAATFAFLFGVPAYVLGGPLVHWSHGDFDKGLVSAGANIVGPIAAGLIGGRVRCGQSNHPRDCGARGFFAGMAVALVTIPIIDAFALGWEEVRADEVTGRTAPPRSGVAVTPMWQVGPRSMTIGATGRF
jgi:hypothetical protein